MLEHLRLNAEPWLKAHLYRADFLALADAYEAAAARIATADRGQAQMLHIRATYLRLSVQ